MFNVVCMMFLDLSERAVMIFFNNFSDEVGKIKWHFRITLKIFYSRFDE